MWLGSRSLPLESVLKLNRLLPLILFLLVLCCVSVEVFQSKVGKSSGFSWLIALPEIGEDDILSCATQLLELLFCLWLLFFGCRKPALYPEGSSTPCTLLYVIIMLGIWDADVLWRDSPSLSPIPLRLSLLWISSTLHFSDVLQVDVAECSVSLISTMGISSASTTVFLKIPESWLFTLGLPPRSLVWVVSSPIS